jgi:hypothetical protein
LIVKARFTQGDVKMSTNTIEIDASGTHFDRSKTYEIDVFAWAAAYSFNPERDYDKYETCPLMFHTTIDVKDLYKQASEQTRSTDPLLSLEAPTGGKGWVLGSFVPFINRSGNLEFPDDTRGPKSPRSQQDLRKAVVEAAKLIWADWTIGLVETVKDKFGENKLTCPPSAQSAPKPEPNGTGGSVEVKPFDQVKGLNYARQLTRARQAIEESRKGFTEKGLKELLEGPDATAAIEAALGPIDDYLSEIDEQALSVLPALSAPEGKLSTSDLAQQWFQSSQLPKDIQQKQVDEFKERANKAARIILMSMRDRKLMAPNKYKELYEAVAKTADLMKDKNGIKLPADLVLLGYAIDRARSVTTKP